MNSKDNFGQKSRVAGVAFRYQLKRTAQSILAVTGKPWKEQHRTCWCSRSLRQGDDYTPGGGGNVEVYRNEARDGASLVGLNRCGNVHTCPVCAAKVNEPRRTELQAGMVRNVSNGGTAYLLNFTFQHSADEPLAWQLKNFGKAFQAFQNSREWKALQSYAGNLKIKRNFKGEKREVTTIGVVNSLEFTVSMENGWHPHRHMLIFCKRNAFGEDEHVDAKGNVVSRVVDELKKRWVAVVRKNGLGDQQKIDAMIERGLVIRSGEKAAEYIAKFGRDEKWGASGEMARAHSKIGAAGERYGIQHFTPFQLLAWIDGPDESKNEEDLRFRGWCIARFREYAEAVEGKKALVWAPGLKDALGLKDLSDDELVEEKPMQVFVGSLNAEQFSIILSRKQVPQFIEYVATCCDDQSHLDEFVDSLRDVDKVASGALLVKRRSGRSVAYA